jgi:hypothetical protein
MSYLTNTMFIAHKHSAVESENTSIRSTEITTGINRLKKTVHLGCEDYSFTFISQHAHKYTSHGLGAGE